MATTTMEALPEIIKPPLLTKFFVDLKGPINPASLTGKKYIMYLTDAASDKTWTYMLNDKAAAGEEIKIFFK